MSAFCKKVQGKFDDKKFQDVSVEDCGSDDYSIDKVQRYIESLEGDMNEILQCKPDIPGLCKVFNDSFDKGIQANIFYNYDNGSTIIPESFKKTNESNPFSFFASMFILDKRKDELNKLKGDEKLKAQLEAVHDGWTICRLMRLNDDGTFEFDYKTNRYQVKDDNNKESLILDTSTADKDYINWLIKLGDYGDSSAVYKALDATKTGVVQLKFRFDGEDKSTYIRLNQLCMFLPFENLHESIQDMDKKFNAEYIKDDRIKNCIGVFKTKAPQGGSKKSASKYTRTEEKVKVGNKTRVVHKGPRKGVKYVKQDGGFVPLSKAK